MKIEFNGAPEHPLFCILKGNLDGIQALLSRALMPPYDGIGFCSLKDVL